MKNVSKDGKVKKPRAAVGCECCRRYLLKHSDDFASLLQSSHKLLAFGTYQISLSILLRRMKPPVRHAKSRLHELAVQDFADTAAKNALAASSIEVLGPPEDEWRKCL